MALNIKNKRVCELARRAADRFETTQVDVIERALLELLNTRKKFDRLGSKGSWNLLGKSMTA